MGPIDMGILVRIGQAVFGNLSSAEVVGMLPDEHHTERREGYWEEAFAVTWRRPIPEGMSRIGTDGYIYGTHRVHVNSEGDSACFVGHYDMSHDEALLDMFDRAKLGPIHEAERLRVEWRKADDGWIAAREEIARLDRDLQLSVCYSPQAIRDSFDGADEDHPDAKWAREASDEQLLEVSQSIIGSDPTWRDFHRNIELGIEYLRSKEEKKA